MAGCEALHRHGVDREALLRLGHFLAERWDDWDRSGRPLMAEGYRVYLAALVRLLQRVQDMSFDEIADAIGHQGPSSRVTLHRIWPDWTAEQKERVAVTLRHAWDHAPAIRPSMEEINAFADFLATEHQDSIFLRLQSFERNVFDDRTDNPVAGMTSDLEGLAVAVEQAVRAMGGTGGQLYEMFRQLWAGSAVETLLKRHDGTARQARDASRWQKTKEEIERLRVSSAAGAIVADLVMAHRLRGAVHQPVHETDDWELEKLVLVLLRAAALTHAHLARTSISATAAAAAPAPAARRGAISPDVQVETDINPDKPAHVSED
jgi:hypothetical protein